MAFDSIARFLPKGIRRLLAPRRSGLEQARPYMRALLGEQRLVAVDVGAAKGVLPHWQSLDGVALIYQIDPRASACEELVEANKHGQYPELYRVLCAAVAGSDGPRILYVSQVATGTSLFYPDIAAAPDAGAYVSLEYFFPITEQSIETQTLDCLLNRVDEFQLDLIKLDIQGAELEALRGLKRRRLDDLLAVEVEVGLSNIYEKACDFHDIQQFMKENHFDLFDVRVARCRLPAGGSDTHYQTQVFSVHPNSPTISARACEFDAVYFRKRSHILETRDPAKIRRMMVCYLTYNYFAEAYSLVEDCERLQIFAPQLSSALKDLVVTIHREREFQPWLADTKVWNFARRLATRMAPRSAPRWCQYMYQNYPSG